MRAIAVGCGLLLVVMAGLLTLLWLVVLLSAGAAGAENVVLAGSLALLALVFGLALVYIGARGGVTASRRRLGPSAPALGLVTFLGVLALGSLALAGGNLSTMAALPGLHFLGALLPALAVLGLAALPHGGMPWRQALAGLAYGGCAATLLALLIEGALGLLILVALLSGPAGDALAEALNGLIAQAQAGSLDTEQLASALAPLITPATVAAAFLLLGLLAPLTEEMAKALGVTLAEPPSPDRAWLWGVAVGAGFGVTEALTFGAMGLGLPSWPLNLGVRAIATLMHATMGGLAGLGVFYLSLGGQRGRGLALLGLAWLGHAAWNSGVLLVALTGILVGIGGPAWSAPVGALAGLAMVALFALIVLLFARLSVAGAHLAAGAVGDPATPWAAPPETAEMDEVDVVDEVDEVAANGSPDEPPAPEPPSAGPPEDPPWAPSSPDAPAGAQDAVPAPVDGAPDETAPGPGEEIPGLGIDVTWRPPEPGGS